MQTSHCLTKLLVLGALAVSVASSPVMSAEQKNGCAGMRDWHEAVSCYDKRINAHDEALVEKYIKLYGGDESTQKIVKYDRDNWFADNKKVCGISNTHGLTEAQLLCLSLKYKDNVQVMSTYLEVMSGFINRPSPMLQVNNSLDKHVRLAMRQLGLSPVAMLNSNNVPVYYVIDSDANKCGMYFFDAHENQMTKLDAAISEVTDFTRSGDRYLLLLRSSTKTYEIIDEAYMLLKMQPHGATYTTARQRLVAARYYKKEDVCAKSNPVAASIDSASLVTNHRFMLSDSAGNDRIEFTLDKTDCGTNITKTFTIEKNI